MIRAICFDLDGVYFTSQGFSGFKANLINDYSLDPEKVNYIFHKSPEINNFKLGKMSEGEFWRYFNNELGLDLNLMDIENMLMATYSEDPNVKNFVLRCKEAKYKTCICSNNFLTRIRSLQEGFNFEENFDVKVYSFEVGTMKPELKIYQEVSIRAKSLYKEIVYSDDDEEKLSGAKKLGINAFVYTNFDDFVNRLYEFGVKV